MIPTVKEIAVVRRRTKAISNPPKFGLLSRELLGRCNPGVV
jgi:hypothetical protein